MANILNLFKVQKEQMRYINFMAQESQLHRFGSQEIEDLNGYLSTKEERRAISTSELKAAGKSDLPSLSSHSLKALAQIQRNSRKL